MTTSARPDPKGIWIAPRAVVRRYVEGLEPLPTVPVMLCKGLCADSCGPAPMTPVEFARVEEAIGRPLEVNAETLRCSALNDEGRCDAYNVRPLVCRVWGLSEGMMCPHGCVTTSGEYLTRPEALGLFAKACRDEGAAMVPPLSGIDQPPAS